jgi:EAL domain-containing protein (putative c-di-GMP-specific phosphodiesterase class I)
VIAGFGAGRSVWCCRCHLPVALKIDRSLLSGPASLKESGALLHTLLQLGKALNVETLAEGIEEPLNSRPSA